MLSGEGNDNGEKTTTGVISKKATLHVHAAHFFVHFFGVVYIARLQRETSRNFLVSRFMDSLSAVFLYLCVNFHKCVSIAF